MSQGLDALLIGAGVGLSIAAPIGPTSMMCIERTLAAGITRGVATGFGVATVHLAYGAVAVLGGVSLAQEWLRMALLPALSGLVLLWFAIRVLRRSMVLGGTGTTVPSLMSSYCGAVGFGFLNPVTPVLFAAAVPTLLGRGGPQPVVPWADPWPVSWTTIPWTTIPWATIPWATMSWAAMAATGVFLGSLLWWSILSCAIWLLRSRLSSRGLHLMNKAAGLALLLLAFSMFSRAWAG